MALPRKDVRAKRREEKKAKLEAKSAAKIKRIEEGKNLGARLGNAIGNFADSAASAGGAYLNRVSAGEVQTPAAQDAQRIDIVPALAIAGVGIVIVLLVTGKVRL